MLRLLGRLLVLVGLLLAAVGGLRVWMSLDDGLRAQYFDNPDFSGDVVLSGVDREVSTRQVYQRWHAAPPKAFGVQWSGYLWVDRGGAYTFSSRTAGRFRLFVDGQLVLAAEGGDEGGQNGATSELAAGPHRVVIQYSRPGGRLLVEWAWAEGTAPVTGVPSSALTTRPSRSLRTPRALVETAWTALLAIAGVLGALAGLAWAANGWRSRRGRTLVLRVAVLVVLAVLYWAGATRHAEEVNTSKARADQTAYLWDAQRVYANWHGLTPPVLIGQRVRMVVYPAFLALSYDPGLTDPEFFEVAKRWNIWLSLALLGFIGILAARSLPPLPAMNLTLIVAFGYFAFRAGYSQPELLYYSLFFATFLLSWELIRSSRPAVGLGLALLAGAAGGLTHLTKALMPPFIALLAAVLAGSGFVALVRARLRPDPAGAAAGRKELLWKSAASVLLVGSFLAVVYPYIANSKREFGSYFYNTNTAYYAWYDTGALARELLLPRTDHEGRVAVAKQDLPTIGSYWRSHSIPQMLERLELGFRDMIVRSYRSFWYLKYVLMYAVFALVLAAANRRACAELVRSRAAPAVFLVLYAGAYLVSIAFFSETSGTGTTRFILAHVLPFLFVVSRFLVRQPFVGTTWSAGGVTVTPGHFHLLVAITLALDLSFSYWPRIMSTYGGF